MSKNWMTDIWSWDHCFNAMALARELPDLAWDQLLIMADHQDEHGLYPDSMNDVRKHFNFTKPPIHGWATMEVWDRNPIAATRVRLETIFHSLRRWTEWWLKYRRLSGQELPFYLHGNDSGWDNSTLFDAGVPLITPDLSAFLIVQMDALERLARHLGYENDAIAWAVQSNRMLMALLKQLWNIDRFDANLALSGRTVHSSSLQLFLPLLLGQRLPQTMRELLVRGLDQFETAYGLGSESPRSTEYEADGYWRGPIWGASTYLLIDGLQRCGYPERARRIATKFCDLCARHGLPENFNAKTGAAQRDPAYTWTASCFLLAAEHALSPAAR
jgi:glycogen debranching enzyme